jgi:hypothetical protein
MAAASTTNAPAARFEHTAVWSGSEMIVWGGRDGFVYYDTGGRYNPSTDSWTATTRRGKKTLPTIRVRLSLIILPDMKTTRLADKKERKSFSSEA